MKKLTAKLLVLTALIFSISCNKYDLEKSVPRCLNSEIKKLEQASCNKVAVEEYEFQGKLVYVLQNGCCCDQSSRVVDDECEYLGSLNGFGGNREIKGEMFYDVATFKRTIWKPKN